MPITRKRLRLWLAFCCRLGRRRRLCCSRHGKLKTPQAKASPLRPANMIGAVNQPDNLRQKKKASWLYRLLRPSMRRFLDGLDHCATVAWWGLLTTLRQDCAPAHPHAFLSKRANLPTGREGRGWPFGTRGLQAFASVGYLRRPLRVGKCLSVMQRGSSPERGYRLLWPVVRASAMTMRISCRRAWQSAFQIR